MESEYKTQRKLAEEIIVAVKSRLFDLEKFEVKNIEANPAFSPLNERLFVSIELPNGDEVQLTLYTKRAGVK